MKYETIKEFTKTVKKSRSTIYRFYTKNPDLFAETKLENRKRIIPITHQKYLQVYKRLSQQGHLLIHYYIPFFLYYYNV